MVNYLAAMEKEGGAVETDISRVIHEHAPAEFAKQLNINAAEELEHGALFEKCLRAMGAIPTPVGPGFHLPLERIQNYYNVPLYFHHLSISYLAERIAHESLRDWYEVAPSGCVKETLGRILPQEEECHIATLRSMVWSFKNTYDIPKILKKYEMAIYRTSLHMFFVVNQALAYEVKTPFFIMLGFVSRVCAKFI